MKWIYLPAFSVSSSSLFITHSLHFVSPFCNSLFFHYFSHIHYSPQFVSPPFFFFFFLKSSSFSLLFTFSYTSPFSLSLWIQFKPSSTKGREIVFKQTIRVLTVFFLCYRWALLFHWFYSTSSHSLPIGLPPEDEKTEKTKGGNRDRTMA